ncbi:hypothetical protein [Alistipes sp. D31t1_170403_E11]|uniref:hypothetical protein n=1 Tax=Alistipes sp. D31t1_170403_E11 TaxID=2787128 RepID=UPI00189AA74D|nr:hypothetical protein [Alistipes sp. D31t1_170403_E11]
MTKDQLKELSNKTFFDNNVGGITAESHRAFNEKLIESIPDPVEIATNEKVGKVKGSTAGGKIRVETDGTMGVNQYVAQGTFVIDSNQALTAWANNVAGNDYSVVIIQAGKWESDTAVNLTSTKTKVVIGMPGSELGFTSTKGLYYDTLPTTPDYFMDGVTISLNRTIGPDIPTLHTAFSNIANLYRCIAKRTVNAPDMSLLIQGFSQCKHVTSCQFICTDITSTLFINGFSECEDLYQCHGAINGVDNSTMQITVYALCNRLINCSLYFVNAATSNVNGAMMSDCNYIVGMYITKIGADIGNTPLVSCKRMFLCTIEWNNLSVFSSCESTKGIPVDDTPAGGFNQVIVI